MSSQETIGDTVREDEIAPQGDRENDSLASKLSKELNNWRRRRTDGRTRRNEGSDSSFQSEPARTIKVRGHETLVIRKPKLAPKPPVTNESSGD